MFNWKHEHKSFVINVVEMPRLNVLPPLPPPPFQVRIVERACG